VQITVALDLTADEKKQLAAILRCKDTQVETALEPYGRAALQEYVRLFLGQRVSGSGSDFREYRLFLLIREVFKDQIPDEQQISSLFQLPLTQSRALLRTVMAKYQYELRPVVDASLAQAVKSAKQPEAGADYELPVNSANIVDGLNRLLTEIDGSLPKIMRVAGTVSIYCIKPSSYAELAKRLKVK
jgi:hypothetical protein